MNYLSKNNFFNLPGTQLNQNLFFDSVKKNYQQEMLNCIRTEFEEKDLEIKNSRWRKQNGYIVHGKAKRTIVTYLGAITFYRTKYRYFDEATLRKKYVTLLDPYIQVEKYQKISLELKIKILEKLSIGTRQKNIVDFFYDANISRNTVSKIARSVNLKSLNDQSYFENYNVPKNIDEFKYIYIDIDDTFLSLKKDKVKKKFRIRLASIHNGVDYSKGKKYGRLINKRIFYREAIEKSSISTRKYAEELLRYINIFYGDISNKKIVVCGDGAPWIKQIAVYLNGEFVLDKFHLIKEVYRTFNYRSEVFKSGVENTNFQIYRELAYYLNNNKTNLFIHEMSKLKKENFLNWNYDKKTKFNKLMNYVINNYDGIANWEEDWYVGTHAESAVSHIVKSLRSYGAKIYNYSTFMNILNLRIANINSIKPIDLYVSEQIENNFETIDNLEVKKLGTKKEIIRRVGVYHLKNINLPILEAKTSPTQKKVRSKVYGSTINISEIDDFNDGDDLD